MPTYTRNADKSVAAVIDVAGTQRFVGPGESVGTYEILGDGWTLTDPGPYWNPALAVHDDIAGPRTIELDSDTWRVEVWNNSPAVVTLFLNSAENTPGIRVEAYGVRTVEVRKRVSALIMSFSAAVSAGQVVLTEWRK